MFTCFGAISVNFMGLLNSATCQIKVPGSECQKVACYMLRNISDRIVDLDLRAYSKHLTSLFEQTRINLSPTPQML